MYIEIKLKLLNYIVVKKTNYFCCTIFEIATISDKNSFVPCVDSLESIFQSVPYNNKFITQIKVLSQKFNAGIYPKHHSHIIDRSLASLSNFVAWAVVSSS